MDSCDQTQSYECNSLRAQERAVWGARTRRTWRFFGEALLMGRRALAGGSTGGPRAPGKGGGGPGGPRSAFLAFFGSGSHAGLGFGTPYQMEYGSIPVTGWPSESWPWARPCTWRHSQALARGFIRPVSNNTPILHPVKVCLAAGYSFGSRHPSKGWVRPKQAGWEFRV